MDTPMNAQSPEDRAPPRLAVTAMTPFSRYALLVLAAVVLLLAFGPLWLSPAQMQVAIKMCIYLALAQMWNLLAGYAGVVSVGQQAYVGLGGYMLFFFTMFRDAHPLFAIVLGGVVSGLVAIPTALIVFRLKGAYFAIGTWVVAEVLMLTFAQISPLGGGSIISLRADIVREVAASAPTRRMIYYWLALGLAVGSVGLAYALLRSRFGLALAAIRDSQPAAESLGVDTANAKYVVYIAVAAFTGVVGGLAYLNTASITPRAAFDVMEWTAYIIFIVVIGGVGRIEGPIIGTIVYFILQGFLADLGTVYLIILGALAVAIMLAAPKGIWGLVVDRFGIEVFPVQRRLVLRTPPKST
jgi:branched-chain amino acid transport system permease protein